MQRLVIWIGQEWNPQLRGLRFFGAQTLPLRLAPPLQYQLHMFHFLISTYRSVDSRKEIAQMFQTAIIWLSLLSYYFNLVFRIFFYSCSHGTMHETTRNISQDRPLIIISISACSMSACSSSPFGLASLGGIESSNG